MSLHQRISELEKTIEQQRRFAVRVRTESAVARILAESGSREQILARVLETVCENLGWNLGVLWRVDTAANLIRPTQIHHAPAPELEQFATATRGYTFPPGRGLPGEVWAKGQPVSMADIQNSPNYPRLPIAYAAGLHGALAFPIVLAGEVLGVMEFYTRATVAIDEDLLATMAAIGAQLGQYLARTRIETALELSEQNFRLIAETAPDAIVTIDKDGTILFVNRATEEIFGYKRAELVGSNLTKLIPERLRERHNVAMSRYVHTRRKTLDWRGIELAGLRRDGREVPIEVAFGEYIEAGRQLFTGFIRDISGRSRPTGDE